MAGHVTVMSSLWTISLLLLPLMKGENLSPWRACTDLLPLDLLARVLSRGGAALQGVHILQDESGRSLHFSSPAPALSYPASELFTSCPTFPAEFSIVAKLKSPHSLQASEYVFSILREDGEMLLALRLSAKGLQLIFSSKSGRQHLTFRGVAVADGAWHSVLLSVSGPHVALTLDCGAPLKLVHPSSFPSDLSTESSWVHVGSRRKWKGLFSGILQQLLLLPGSDATVRVCPAPRPSPADLSIPSEAGLRVSVGSKRFCSHTQKGQLWFDTHKKSLFLCDGSHWLSVLQEKERLDYVDDHQDLHTSSETLDIEVFRIRGAGLFAAVAQRFGSAVYHWRDGFFHLYQNISTRRAQSWRHFTIGKEVFLAVSNAMQPQSDQKEESVIYKWSVRRRKFVCYQTLHTHGARDWEAFNIHNDTFLAVANHRTESGNHNIDSVIYKWNPGTCIFEAYQSIPTSGAFDWEFFSVGPYHLLAVANAFDGSTTHTDSSIYVWISGTFQPFQTIKTYGATDWEMFKIGNRVFLAVANGHMLYNHGQSLYAINSTIYELNMASRMFLKFQDIITYSAVDWEFFTLGEEHFLVVANSYDGSSYALNSVIYRWQGYEGFVPVHRLPTIGCSDWEFFTCTEGSYLMYSSAKSPLNKVFKLRTH